MSLLPGPTGFLVLSEDTSTGTSQYAPRLGRVSLCNGKTVHTPCLLVHTGRGCSPNVTWDGLEHIGELAKHADSAPAATSLACQLDVLQLIHQHGAIKKYLAASGKDASDPKGFLGIPDGTVAVAVPRSPAAYEHIGMTRNSTDTNASFMTSQGAAWASPEDYMDIAWSVGADIIVALGDEVPSDARTNRVVESSKRTIQWMTRAMDWVGAHPACDHACLLVCPIVGGRSVEKRIDAMTYMPYIDDARVHGVYVSGLGTGESASERLEVLKTVAERVPRQKLRMVSGVSNPMEVLEAIRCGMDMFDTSFVGMVTRAGLALCFPTDSASCVEKAEIVASSHAETAAQCGLDGMKMNLWSGTYKLDRSPLVHDCPCGTCRDHTRGYVHHLLVTHEMTANVLLEQHNVYHMLRFFTGIRRAIRDGVFETYYQAFVGHVQRWQRCSQ